MNNLKKLTLSFPIKNDDYYLNFIDRLNFSLEYNGWIINKLGLANFIDIVVVDWGSERPASKDLIISKENQSIIKFLEINEDITLKESDVKFHISKANNTALRRSNSEYILYTAHDLLFSETTLLNLYNLLHSKYLKTEELNNSIINIQRFFLPEELFLIPPSFNYLSNWIKTSSFLYGDLSGNTGEGKAGHLASKIFWNKIGGINEKFALYGLTDTDVHSRANMIAPYYDSFNFGINLYKMPRGTELGRKKTLSNLSKNWTSFDSVMNKEDSWGLKKYNIPLTKPNISLKKINPKELKIIQKISRKKTLNVLFSIFLIPVSLRIFYVKLSELILYKKIISLINIGNTRCFISFGYEGAYGPLLLTKHNCATDIIILDNIRLAAEKKYNQNKKTTLEKSSIGILFERSMLVALAKNKFLSHLINHLGYFRMINALNEKQFVDIFDNIPSEENSNILLFRESEIKHLTNNLIKKMIDNNSKKIFSAFFYGDKIRDIYLNDFEIIDFKNFKIKILIKKNKESISRENLKNLNLIKLFFYFIITNIVLSLCNVFRIIKSLIYKFFRLNIEEKLVHHKNRL